MTPAIKHVIGSNEETEAGTTVFLEDRGVEGLEASQ